MGLFDGAKELGENSEPIVNTLLAWGHWGGVVCFCKILDTQGQWLYKGMNLSSLEGLPIS